MTATQQIGRTVGFLLFLIMAIGIPSIFLRGLSRAMTTSPDFLNDIVQNALNTRIAVFLDILASALWIVIAIKLFPLLNQYKNSFALWFLGIWLIQVATIVFSNVSHLSLLSSGQVFIELDDIDTAHFLSLAILKIEEYFAAHFIGLILFAAAAFSLYYFFFKTRLIPRWLSVWGMVAITLVFIASWLNIFDITVSFHFYSQNGVFMITLTGWLIAKGFYTDPQKKTISST
ncbi:MAG: DUF4386 domain-containing protein [Bacteroidota bacterium]